MNIGATGENSAKLVVSQSYLGTVFSISSPFRLPLVKKEKIFFPWNCGNLNTWALFCQACTFLICQRLPVWLLHGPLWMFCALREVTSNWDFKLASGKRGLTWSPVLLYAKTEFRITCSGEKKWPRKNVFIKNNKFSQKLLCESQLCSFLATYFFLLCFGNW